MGRVSSEAGSESLYRHGSYSLLLARRVLCDFCRVRRGLRVYHVVGGYPDWRREPVPGYLHARQSQLVATTGGEAGEEKVAPDRPHRFSEVCAEPADRQGLQRAVLPRANTETGTLSCLV